MSGEERVGFIELRRANGTRQAFRVVFRCFPVTIHPSYLRSRILNTFRTKELRLLLFEDLEALATFHAWRTSIALFIALRSPGNLHNCRRKTAPSVAETLVALIVVCIPSELTYMVTQRHHDIWSTESSFGSYYGGLIAWKGRQLQLQSRAHLEAILEEYIILKRRLYCLTTEGVVATTGAHVQALVKD